MNKSLNLFPTPMLMGLRRKGFLELLLVSLIVFISFDAEAFRNSVRLQYKPKIYKDISLSTEIDLRSVGTNNDYRHFDAGFNIPLKFIGKGWSTDIRMRAAFIRSRDNTGWDLERRPHIALNNKSTTEGFRFIPKLKWKFRTRYEYRLRASGNDTPRVRVLGGVESHDAYYNIKPFMDNELFYDFDKSRLIRHRIDLGLKLPKYKKAKTSLKYRVDTSIDAGTELNHLHSMVLTFRF